jgi:hypothetical protein
VVERAFGPVANETIFLRKGVNRMKVRKALSTIAASGLLSLASAGLAYGAEVEISNTGADSNNTVSIDNNQSTEVNNNQSVVVNNNNNQTATTGDVTVSENTTVDGSAVSGNATNNSEVTTSISFGDAPGLPGPGGSGGPTGGTGGTGGPTGGTGGVGGSTSTGGVGGAGSLSAGVGGGSLPRVGVTNPLDVSSLRNLVSPSRNVPEELVQQSRGLTAGLLSAAALLSLLGAIGSAVYAGRKEKSQVLGG